LEGIRDDRSEGRSRLEYDGETIIEEGVSQRFTPSSDEDDSEDRDKMGAFFEQSRVIHAGTKPPSRKLP
jgi:hypothetical protein